MQTTAKDTNKSPHKVQTIAVVLLLLMFAFASLLLIALGASVYEKNVTDMQEVSKDRTALAYVTQKVRQADAKGSIRCGAFPVPWESSYHSDALIFTKEIRGENYDTYLYAYDGSLCELTVRQGSDITPDMGAPILPAEALIVREDEAITGLLHIGIATITDNVPKEQTLKLFVRSARDDE
ncbi:MAG: DUF4860 domain-containing protein [Lachnospiraceae bacterium]|nr:DUF4860 domain-containing protein [Lachnospiraceae bacterium]